MNYSKKKKSDKPAVKERVIESAATAFAQFGIKQVKMDDIASSLGISKRTIYELFSDKSDLLLEVVKMRSAETQAFLDKAVAESDNILEVILKHYKRNVTEFRTICPLFLLDLNKYPAVLAYINQHRLESAGKMMEAFRVGIEQGIFCPDINYEIIRVAFVEEMNLFLNSELCEKYPLVEIYETMLMMHMRGISTEKGRKIVDDFIAEHKEEIQSDRTDK
ncbi:MAG: TetR/AcrR family transcriptional regulator [Phocaeicola sp.]